RGVLCWSLQLHTAQVCRMPRPCAVEIHVRELDSREREPLHGTSPWHLKGFEKCGCSRKRESSTGQARGIPSQAQFSRCWHAPRDEPVTSSSKRTSASCRHKRKIYCFSSLAPIFAIFPTANAPFRRHEISTFRNRFEC